jgi:hypothetical protein
MVNGHKTEWCPVGARVWQDSKIGHIDLLLKEPPTYTGHALPVCFRGERWDSFKALALILGIGKGKRKLIRRILRRQGIYYHEGEQITVAI